MTGIRGEYQHLQSRSIHLKLAHDHRPSIGRFVTYLTKAIINLSPGQAHVHNLPVAIRFEYKRKQIEKKKLSGTMLFSPKRQASSSSTDFIRSLIFVINVNVNRVSDRYPFLPTQLALLANKFTNHMQIQMIHRLTCHM